MFFCAVDSFYSVFISGISLLRLTVDLVPPPTVDMPLSTVSSSDVFIDWSVLTPSSSRSSGTAASIYLWYWSRSCFDNADSMPMNCLASAFC